MSFNRENVIWESKNGSWNRGFYTAREIGDPFSEDFDSEWDVEYDYSSFEWVSTGHMTKKQADDSWRGANPGTMDVSPYKGNATDNKQYDLMAEWFNNPSAKEKHDRLLHNKNVREHFKKLQKKFDEADRYEMKNVTVTFKMDDNVYESLGMSQSFSARMTVDGDWLGLYTRDGFKRVYSTTTNKFAKNIHEIAPRRF